MSLLSFRNFASPPSNFLFVFTRPHPRIAEPGDYVSCVYREPDGTYSSRTRPAPPKEPPLGWVETDATHAAKRRREEAAEAFLGTLTAESLEQMFPKKPKSEVAERKVSRILNEIMDYNLPGASEAYDPASCVLSSAPAVAALPPLIPFKVVVRPVSPVVVAPAPAPPVAVPSPPSAAVPVPPVVPVAAVPKKRGRPRAKSAVAAVPKKRGRKTRAETADAPVVIAPVEPAVRKRKKRTQTVFYEEVVEPQREDAFDVLLAAAEEEAMQFGFNPDRPKRSAAARNRDKSSPKVLGG